MKRGRKNTSIVTAHTIAGNDLRKRLRLVGPVIGADFVINPDAKGTLKKSKGGRPSWQVLDCETIETWTTQGSNLPDSALLIQKSPSDSSFDARRFSNHPTALWANEPDELSLHLLQVLYSNISTSMTPPPSALAWGKMQNQVTVTTEDAAVQSIGAAVQSWGFGRVVVNRIQSGVANLLRNLAPSIQGAVHSIYSGCDGVLCEFIIQIPSSLLTEVSVKTAEALSQMPFAVVSLERGPEFCNVRLISRMNALAFEGGPATLVTFQFQPKDQKDESLQKAS